MKNLPNISIAVMITLITTMLVAILLSSCSVTRKAASESKTELRDQSQVDTQRDSTAVSEKTTKDSLVLNVVEKTKIGVEAIVYDPDKPIDPDTGLPPVKSRTITTTETTREINAKTGGNTETKDSIAVSERDSSKLDIKKKEQSESKDIVKKSRSLWWLWVLLGVVGTVVVMVWWKWRILN